MVTKKVSFLDGYKPNFETLKRAAQAGDLALMHCKNKETGKDVAVVVAVHEASGEYVMTPLAKLFDGNPYEELLSPLEF